MKDFLIKLIVFTLLVSAIDFAWIHFAPVEKHIPQVWPILAFFFVTTAAFHFFALRASKGRPQGFIRFYMGSSALRFFVYILVILAYRFYDKPTLIPFAIGFMGHYLLFTVFEVPVLLKELKKG